MSKDILVVFGTFNRIKYLPGAIQSCRMAAEGLRYDIAVVDGGSTDGSRELLAKQRDVVLITQEGPLTGAVKAFNLGFAHAVDAKYKYVFHFNDDAEVVTEKAFSKAIQYLEDHPNTGEVAFEFNLRGAFAFEYVNHRLYANFGVVRTAAGMAAARDYGDVSGRNWWNPDYRTYGADCEFGIRLWRTGWYIHPGEGLRVNDLAAKDTLRESNDYYNVNRSDSKLFWDRWRDWSL